MKRIAVLLVTVLLVGCSPGASPKPLSAGPSPGANAPVGPSTAQMPGKKISTATTPDTAPKPLHPADPDHIVSMGVTELTAWGRKTTTDPRRIAQIMAVLTGGKFVGPIGRTDATPAGGYDIVINLDNQQFRSLEYWPGANHYNLADIDHQRYWSVPGLEEAMRPLLPPKYIGEDEVRAIAGKLDPKAEWWTRFDAKGSFPVDGDFIWVAVGFEPGEVRVAYELNPVTGAVLNAEPPETTAPAKAAVREFSELVAEGKNEQAWNLVHSTARNPNPGVTEAARKSQFLDWADKRRGSPAKVESAQWNHDYYKYYDCQCMIFDVVMVNFTLASEAGQPMPVAKDRDGVWRILWRVLN